MEKRQYVCEKCGNTHYTEDRIQTTGGNFAKVFDVQNKNSSRFLVLSVATQSCTEPKHLLG